jgi:hypothetical protein
MLLTRENGGTFSQKNIIVKNLNFLNVINERK